MARNQVNVAATADEVFSVLPDPWAYPKWVVGAKRIRHVDPEWPAPGARFHHTVGAGPASLDDTSKLVEVELSLFRDGVLPDVSAERLPALTESAVTLSERLVVLMRRKMLLPTLRALAERPRVEPPDEEEE